MKVVNGRGCNVKDYNYLSLDKKENIIFKLINKNYDGTYECETKTYYDVGCILITKIKRLKIDDYDVKYELNRNYYLKRADLDIKCDVLK